MRVLFVSDTAHLPELRRGVEINTDLLIHRLRPLGCEGMVLCGLHSRGTIGKWASLRLRMGDRTRAVTDRSQGYLTARAWDVDAALDRALDELKPDVVVVQGYIHRVARCVERGLACIYYEHSFGLAYPDGCRCPRCAKQTGTRREGGAIPRDSVVWLACSSCLAHYHGDPFGLSYEVLNPITVPENCRADRRNPRAALLVGITLLKGADRVLELARARSDVPFEVFDNIPQKTADENRLAAGLAQRPNVTIRAPVTPQTLYRDAKVVLIPSQIESWGRIASEAQVNGIPVLASNRGGLPESIGPGGVCLDLDAPLSLWLETFSRLWDDHSYYQSLSDAALAWSRRPEFQPEAIAAKFMSLLERAVSKANHRLPQSSQQDSARTVAHGD